MRTFTPVLLVATVAAVASAQSSSGTTTTASLSSASGSGSASMSAELAAISECNSTQLDAGEAILTSNQRAEQCEEALSLQSGTMLQVTTADATEMCDTASCKAALQELYNELPNCRYNLWGLQYSAKKLLEYCGITPTNSTDSDSSSGSVGWSVNSGSASFAPAGATDAPSTASSTTGDSSAGSSAATTTTAVSTMLAATVSLIAAYLA
ncbi:hypothetical protein F441_11298 [Phytophthora nicotianae CJ01A1]|uniref:Elicitin-like protein n=6 Tax=Phytophthora nicotianae TaxID=4792 RepID=W2Q1M5_PHYN3|nr:hypothetical protein PPTG_13458 [Phytophthora nicotianae INRA-310]ETI43783.1 hypothetical protein F443_11381 [Phytophthora nicotianae P1569]ETK83848.1 hypothetical protein L915_11071 [Phytophthora nicotianae]ETO72459.1 hypothetical protein F444_11451 [Phytophthora nicotianae P1976]ETP13594.1 hypothetical protein F441_11298 [Phytophthora nicotianae CJ01A1]ETP41657.1 hypothetical protein F442_11266 [Phytophthora nicotianae P10297]KUF64879.1 hypothetical protein AM587_10017702 [Phytophthora n